MTGTYVELVPASHSLLPPLCRQCAWWQRTSLLEGAEAETVRQRWLESVSRDWGSCGVALVQGRETLGAVQFAPVRTLPRALGLLDPRSSPDSALIFCLRLRKGQPADEARPLLHRALASLHERGTPDVYALARPLGSTYTHGAGNVFGLEFLLANGFHPVGHVGTVRVLRCDLRGLLPLLSDFLWAWRWARHGPPTPTPVS